MKVNLKQPIPDFSGEPILNQKQKVLTFGEVIRTVLTTPKEKESGDDKLKRFQLGLRCVADTVDLSVDDRSLIKGLLSEFDYSPIVYGRIHVAFEEPGEESSEKQEEKEGEKAKKKSA